MFWLGSAPSLMPLGSPQGWAHLSRALQAGSAVCWIDLSPGPPESFSLEAEKILSPRVIAFHQRGLNKQCFPDCLLGLSVLLVLTQPRGSCGGGWLPILLLRAPCCRSTAFTCDGNWAFGAFLWAFLGAFSGPRTQTHSTFSRPLSWARQQGGSLEWHRLEEGTSVSVIPEGPEPLVPNSFSRMNLLCSGKSLTTSW